MVNDFCTLVFSDAEDIHDRASIRIDEIRHYKEKNGLEHEFLLVGVRHGEKYYLLRIERSTPARVRRTFWQKMKQTSASILPALDTVSISSSLKRLTIGMNCGPIIHVATLPTSSAVISLHDFCLLLSLFPSLSPIYKLKEEQCCWFCNVIFATISSMAHIPPIPEEGFKRAGKYGRVSINVSAKARQLFIDGYRIVQRLQYESEGVDELYDVNLTLDTAQALAAMLTVQSNEARTHALMSVTSLASYFSGCRQLLLDAGVADDLRLSFISSSADLKALIFLALDALGLSEFNPLPAFELTEKPPGIRKEDVFVEVDRKNVELKYTNALQDLIALLKDMRPIVRSRSLMVLTYISLDEKYLPFILKVIPAMLQSDETSVCFIGLNIMSDMA